MFGRFKSRSQDWSADISPAGKQILIKAGDNLLNAALESGLAWPHDCRVGSCGTCRCTLKQGKIKPLADFSYVLDGNELDAGMILACQTSARSDLVVEVELSGSDSVMPVTSVTGEIAKMRKLTHDIVELTVKTDQNLPKNFLAGQYAELSVAGIEKPRSYSFAKAPEHGTNEEVVFFVRLVPGGEFTEWLFKSDRTGATVDVSGPYGGFWLRTATTTMVCVAGGSGLAPVKSLLESAAYNKVSRNVLFLFGARTQNDLYCLDAMQALQNDWSKASGKTFSFVPVLSEEPVDSGWTGARGLVTDYLQQEFIDEGIIDMKASQGYLCGPPPMIDAAIAVMNNAGLSDEHIFFDKFLDASTMPTGR